MEQTTKLKLQNSSQSSQTSTPLGGDFKENNCVSFSNQSSQTSSPLGGGRGGRAFNEQRMTSLEIAEVTGKPHNDVLKAIRKMEPAWEKVNEGNFSLVKYRDSKGEQRPCYSLTKTECLYVATKFNDEARAKLVLRWEELERERMAAPDMDLLARAVLAHISRLASTNEMLDAINEHLSLENEHLTRENCRLAELKDAAKARELTPMKPKRRCYSITQIARELGIAPIDLNQLLVDKRIQHRVSGEYVLYARYARRGYGEYRRLSFGEEKTKQWLVWTKKGKEFVISLVKSERVKSEK